MTVLNKTRTARLEDSKLAEITTPGDFFVSGSDIVAMAREIREYRQRIAEPLGYSAEDREALLRMAEHLMQYGRTDTGGQEELLREIGAVALRTLTARQAAPAIPKEAAGVIARFNHVCNHHAGWLCDVLEQDVIRRDLFIATEYMTDCYNASLAFGHRPPRDKPIMPAAWYDIMSERLRQINVEGYTYTPEHDDAYGGGELAGAAVCYARHVSTRGWIYAENPAAYQDEGVPDDWPWAEEWWKPASPYRDLEKAGALILAEMERINRTADTSEGA